MMMVMADLSSYSMNCDCDDNKPEGCRVHDNVDEFDSTGLSPSGRGADGDWGRDRRDSWIKHEFSPMSICYIIRKISCVCRSFL